jgi:hypothetical protein
MPCLFAIPDLLMQMWFLVTRCISKLLTPMCPECSCICSRLLHPQRLQMTYLRVLSDQRRTCTVGSQVKSSTVIKGRTKLRTLSRSWTVLGSGWLGGERWPSFTFWNHVSLTFDKTKSHVRDLWCASDECCHSIYSVERKTLLCGEYWIVLGSDCQ